MTNYLLIGGESFQIQKKTIERNNLKMKARNFWHCYDNPSITKIEIYSNWHKWAEKNNIKKFGVRGYNCHQYTLEGLAEYVNPETLEVEYYYLEITRKNNKAYKLIEM